MKQVETFQTAFINSIRIINVYKEEEENLLAKNNDKNEEMSEFVHSEHSLKAKSSGKKKFLVKNLTNLSNLSNNSATMSQLKKMKDDY